MIYFTSDTHFGCESTLHLRPQFKTLEEMDDCMITNWNNTVTNEDIVYILGDFTHEANNTDSKKYLKFLNGKKKILIEGNHDIVDPFPENYNFSDVYPYLELDTNPLTVLFHYPIEFWNKRNNGAIHLHGHMHGSMMYNIHNLISGVKKYDVGVEANNFTPVSLNKIQTLFSTDTSHLNMDFFNSLK